MHRPLRGHRSAPPGTASHAGLGSPGGHPVRPHRARWHRPSKPDEPDVYGLTLQGATAQTGCPFDRPDRIVGDVSTEAFLNLFGFNPFDPPSAATVVQTATGEDSLVVELFDVPWGGGPQTLTHDATGLAPFIEVVRRGSARRSPFALGSESLRGGRPLSG